MIDADAIQIPSTYVDLFENCRNCKLLDREQVREIIDNTPTIEPKRGEWKEWIDCEGEVFWKCSACGQASEASAAGILYKFCPFCGADMRGKDDE